MHKNGSISLKVFFSTLTLITAVVIAEPKLAIAQTPSPGGTAAAPLPPPPATPPAPNGSALPPAPPPPSGSPAPAGQVAPPMVYPNAWAPYPPANDPAYNQRYPKELSYEEGAEIPYGYHKVTKRRVGLIAAGASTFGSLYLITVFGALLSNEPKYAVPVIGPFLGIERPSNSLSGLFDNFANFIFVLDGIGQAAGVAMLIAGIPSKTTLVRNDIAAFKPEFSVGPGSIHMRMRF